MATTAPIGEKRDRDGDSVCPIVQAYKANHRSQWPTEAELDKLAADVTATASAGDKAGNEAAVKALASFIYRNHDKPHASKLEWWYVSGHLGTAKSDPKTAYSFFAAFFRLHVAGDEYAYCVHWAITEAPAVPNASASYALGGDAATATTTAPMPPAFAPGAPASQAVGKYHTFASQDPSTPAVIAQLHSQGKFKTADARVTQQILSMAKGGCIAAPEKMFAEGAAFVRGAAPGEGPTAANGFETLYVEIDGNSFSASMPEGADSPTYTLKLRGESQNNLENNGKNDANGKGFDISLDLTFSPMVSAGFGPVLHGRKGVVSVDNFDDDMFYYFSPRCALVGAGPAEREAAAVLSIDGVRIPLTFANGEDERIWVDHEFGGHPPKTIEEMAALAKAAASATPTYADYSWDWGAFHVPGLGSVSMAIVREENDAIPPNIWGTVAPEYSLPPSAAAAARGETKGPIAPPFAVYFDGSKAKDDPSQPIRIETDPTVPPFSSPDSGMLFPTAFITHIPSFKNLRLRTVAAIPNQEFINMIAKPSYLEGRANVEASWEEEVEDAETKQKSIVVRRSLCGMGFSEARGALNKTQIEQVAMITHATVFMPVGMQPAPPAALLPALPGAILPTVTATLSMMMQFAPPPKPKANQVAFIAATVAAYSAILHYGGVSNPAVPTPAEADANAARFVKWWAEEKRAFLTNTSTPLLRAGVKDIGMCAMMTRELEGVIAQKVPSVVAAIAANPATAAEAALNFILDIETAVENEAAAAAAAQTAASVPAAVAATATVDDSSATPAAAPFDPSAIAALASAAGITIPPTLLANPAALVAMVKAAGIPIPDAIANAVTAAPAAVAAAAAPAVAAASSVAAAAADPVASIAALASAAGITIPPALLADPAALVAMVKTAGIPIPDAIANAIAAVPATVAAAAAPAVTAVTSAAADPVASIAALAATAGITIPPALLADPASLVAMVKASGVPIPDAVANALSAIGKQQ